MKNARIIALLLAIISVFSIFTACSKDTPVVEDVSVENVTDADDNTEMEIDSDESNTLEVTDKTGAVLTIIPIFDKDGSTLIAGYIESAKDKDGNELDETAYSNLKKVVALSINEQNEYDITYDDKDSPIMLDAMSNDKGEIIALADALDLDKNKVTDEYLKATTTIDESGKVFIRLDKDEKGNYVKAEVKTDSTGKTTVTANGKTENAQDSSKAPKLPTVTSKDKDNNNNKTPQSGDAPAKDPQPTPTPTPDPQPEPPAEVKEYYTITLGSGTSFETDADNVEGKTNASGSYEVKIEGPGPAAKYIVTSIPGTTFTGKLEFQLHTLDKIEVKLQNVNISANAKTALKFANLDRVVEKENDSEGTSTSEGSDAGTAIDVPAPKVELSFPEGTNNTIKANGSGTNGSIYSECKLGIKGYGNGFIDGGQSLSGICCTESVEIKNVTLDIKSASKQGISCDKKLTIDSGSITVNSKGDCLHCNKFEMYDGSVTLKSLYTTECCDGIDSNDYILIAGGNLYIEALTKDKYSLKVRKILKSNPKGYLRIDGGSVEASGGQGQVQAITGERALNTVFATCTKPVQFTVGGYTSADGAYSYICSPSGAQQVNISTGASKAISFSSGYGYAKFLIK